MALERTYSTRRQNIVKALVEVIKLIDGTGEFNVNVNRNVHGRLKFWDEVKEFPAIHLNSGSETREYQGGGYKDRYLTVTIRAYVKAENSVEYLDALLEDIETVIEQNSRLKYIDKRGATQYTHQISIVSIDTDEGVLDPLGIGELLLQVHY